MIPKVIHYCWFGGNPLPESALKCIASWRRYLPDYEIREWNESNFDVNMIGYTRDAYEAGKMAFVSDFARFWILYNYGGLYFDTDVELIRPIDDIIARGAFMGAEVDGDSRISRHPKIAPGLCIGSAAGHPLFDAIVRRYNTLEYLGADGTFNKYTMIPLVTDILIASGLQPDNNIQTVEDITIYPAEYFNPLDIGTGRLHKTDNTRSIHWFMASWQPSQPKWLKKAKQYLRRIKKAAEKLMKRNR